MKIDVVPDKYLRIHVLIRKKKFMKLYDDICLQHIMKFPK